MTSMRDLPPGPVRVQLFLGPGVPIPVNADILNALTAVKVESSAGEAQSGFELTFTIPRDSPIQALAPIDVPLLRCVIAVSLRGTTTVLMDGVVTHHDVATNGPQLTLHVKGKDLSAAMDVIAFDGVPYPAMSPSMMPTATSPANSSMVAARIVVFPEPGELIRFSARIPLSANADRLRSARTSFSAKIDSNTSRRCRPVS